MIYKLYKYTFWIVKYPIMACYIIGVCGSSCSGKSTICNEIVNKIKAIKGTTQNLVAVVSQDAYYRGGDSNTNYDIPESIDFDLMISHIKDLTRYKAVNSPIYDFTTHSRKTQTIKVGPAKIIIIEGILIFSQKEIRDLCHLKIFVSAHSELMYARRLERDTIHRGRSIQEVKDRYFRDVLPASRCYVEPTKEFSDIVLINNTQDKFVGLEILLDHIEKKINCSC